MLAIAFSPDGKRLATAAGDESRVTLSGEVKVWDAATGKELWSFHNHHQAATGVAFSPDGKWLASTGFDKRVILYDLSRGKATSFFDGHTPHERRPLRPRRQNAGERRRRPAAGGQRSQNLGTRNGQGTRHVRRPWQKVDALALSPDASLLASGGYDKKVVVFNVKGLLGGTASPQTGSDRRQP